ncbi:homocysteine-responsive endoplasmic reticulum-resident ubiquitin-like domain member 2 protein [Tribolium castaneum]|uniref:homocysteine-responsive endoplasmic reticulum-resident ubiquitin-like domain member 2 protein n=1 Tax=Tribolium castaneum TaxID=7070 RepID=UPI0030FEF643
METLPITLIVKAPNQQIEDQTIKCELSWTINKLKQHLSEVYPSKPPKHEQKLIYSGQLLNDSVTLKDVLRQYDGQETHTVHLVCTPKHTKTPRQEPRQPPQPAMTTPQPPVTPTNSAPEQNVPNMPWGNNPTMDPNQYAMQMAWMQQTYLQYMTQYMQLAANSYGTGAAPAQPTAAPDPQPQQNAPEQAAAQAPAAAVQRDPENPERDWLDVFYMLSRVLVLFSVVYFYSSPLRFVFVLLLGFTLYLYQIGFFRNINNNNNNNNNVVPPEPVPQEEQQPSRLMVVWTFFATFFASLIPEIPNAV